MHKFACYLQECAPQLNGIVDDVSKQAGEDWNSLNKLERQRYEELARQDVERYNR